MVQERRYQASPKSGDPAVPEEGPAERHFTLGGRDLQQMGDGKQKLLDLTKQAHAQFRSLGSC